MTTIPPCAANPALFESTAPNDHLEARGICDICPMRAECRRRLDDEMWKGTPTGTWAGLLLQISPSGRSRIVDHGHAPEAEPVDEEPCRECRLKPQKTRGICAACYSRRYRAGTLDQIGTSYDRSRHSAAEGLELLRMGLTRAEAAAKLGIKEASLTRSIERLLARERGEQVAS